MQQRICIILLLSLLVFPSYQAVTATVSQHSTVPVENDESNPLKASGEQIKWQVVAGGGSSNAVAGGFVLSGTIGQTAATSGSSAAYKLNQGFWQNFEANGCMCGDADGNGIFTISDAVFLINYIFAGGPAPNPLCLGDADGNGLVSISDVVYLINYIFAGGSAPHCP